MIESVQISLPLLNTKVVGAYRILLDLEYPITLIAQVAHQQ